MSANVQRTSGLPPSGDEGGPGEPSLPTREASSILSTPQDPIDSADPTDHDATVELELPATHIVVEHTRDGTVKTHVYAAKGNGQPSDLHESVLGRSALPQGDPTWSSHAPRVRGVGEDSDTPPEAIDLAALTSSVTAALTASATETRTALSETLLGVSGDICQAINLSVQETVAAVRTTHAEALSLGQARAEQQQVSVTAAAAAAVAAAAATEMDLFREQLVPRIDDIVQYVISAGPRMEEIAQYVSNTAAAVERVERAVCASQACEGESSSQGSRSQAGEVTSLHRSMPGTHRPTLAASGGARHSVHGSEEGAQMSMACTDLEDAQGADPAACARSASGVSLAEGDHAQDAEILEKLTGLESKVDTIYRVVVDGEVPDSVPQLGDLASSGVLAGATPEEVEALTRMEAMRREMLAFPDSVQLQLMNENMEALRLALEKAVVNEVPGVNNEVPVTNSEVLVANSEVPANPEEDAQDLIVPNEDGAARSRAMQEEDDAKSRALQEEKAERKRALQEEDTLWKESIQGSHAQHQSMIELLGDKIDGSSHTNKLAMKTFWVFMRLLLQHAKDMGSKMDLLQRDVENRTTYDQDSHTRLSGMLTSIQGDLQTLARQLPAMTDNNEIQRIVAGIQASLMSAAASPPLPVEPEDEVNEEAIPDTHDAQSVVAESQAGASVARSRSLPIPGPDVTPVPLGKSTVTDGTRTSDTDAPSTGAVEASESPTEEKVFTSHEHDTDPQLMFPQFEELISTIKSLQDHMAAMTAQYADLYVAVNRDAPRGGDTTTTAHESISEMAQEVATETQENADGEARTDAASIPPPPPPGRPAGGYGPVPRSIAPPPPPPSIAESPVLEEMGSPAEVHDDPTDDSVSVSPSLSAPVTVQDLERMNDLLQSLAGLVTTSAIEIKSGQKFLHNELQAEIAKVLHAIHPPQELEVESAEQQQDRGEQEVQARAVAEGAVQRQAEEHARSLECIGMIPNLTAALQSVNDHLANKMNTLREDVAGAGAVTREQMQILHQDVRKLITGSIEDSGTLDTVRTVLEGLVAQHAAGSDDMTEQFSGVAKSAEVQGLVEEVKRAHETARAQHQEVLDKLDEWYKAHGEHCEAVEDWHQRHDARAEATEKWHASQDERYMGFDQWRLLYNDQCAGEDTWRQQVDDRHAGYEELQKRSIELLERIEHAPRCRCIPAPCETASVDVEACAEGEAGAESNVRGIEVAETSAGDCELTENRAISSPASSSSATTTCPSTPNRQRRARELCNLFRSFMNEVAPGHDINTCNLPSCGNRSVAEQETPATPHLDDIEDEGLVSGGTPSVNIVPPSEGSEHKASEGSLERQVGEDVSDQKERNCAAETVSHAERDYCRELYEMLLPHFALKERESGSSGSHHSCTGERAGVSSTHTNCPNDAANEATEAVCKRLAELQEKYDAATSDNEELLAQNTGMVSTIMDKDRIVRALMDDKVMLENVLQERDEQLAKQKEKCKQAKRMTERLYRDELGLGNLPDDVAAAEDPALSRRHQLVKQASEQLRQTVDEYEERHAILRAEISALEDQKFLLLNEIAAMGPPPPVPSSHSNSLPSISRRRTGIRARGERESFSEDESVHVRDKEVDDAEEGYVEVEEAKKGSGSGRSRPLSLVGSSARQVLAGASGSIGTRGSRPLTRQSKRAAYSRSQSQGPKRPSGEAMHKLSRVPQLEADIKICKDGLLSETLLSSKTVLTEEQLGKVRMARKNMGDEEEDGGEEEVWSLSCNFRVNLVPLP